MLVAPSPFPGRLVFSSYFAYSHNDLFCFKYRKHEMFSSPHFTFPLRRFKSSRMTLAKLIIWAQGTAESVAPRKFRGVSLLS